MSTNKATPSFDEPQKNPPDGEIFGPNAWYGIARTIGEYCGWPPHRPLPMVVPHGVYWSDEAWHAEFNASLPAIYSFPSSLDALYRERTHKIVIPGCSPWLYLKSTIPQEPDEPRSILVMPGHSSEQVIAETDHKRFAGYVRERFPSNRLRCCMYWHDIKMGYDSHYLKKGFDIVSAGHPFDSGFLASLARIFSEAELVVTNEFGSHVFYAAASKVPVTVVEDYESRGIAPLEVLRRHCGTQPPSKLFFEIAPLFTEQKPDIEAQHEAAELMMGATRKLDPAELRQLLEDLWRTPGFRSRVVFPWRVVRMARRLWSSLKISGYGS